MNYPYKVHVNYNLEDVYKVRNKLKEFNIYLSMPYKPVVNYIHIKENKAYSCSGKGSNRDALNRKYTVITVEQFFKTFNRAIWI